MIANRLKYSMCLLLSILVAKWPSYASGKELSFSLPCVSFVTFCQFMNRYILSIGVGRFRILGGQGLEYWGPKGVQIPSSHMTSY